MEKYRTWLLEDNGNNKAIPHKCYTCDYKTQAYHAVCLKYGQQVWNARKQCVKDNAHTGEFKIIQVPEGELSWKNTSISEKH